MLLNDNGVNITLQALGTCPHGNSHIKILNTSFELLRPSQLCNMHVHSNHILKAYWYYDGRVDMTSKGYMNSTPSASTIYVTVIQWVSFGTVSSASLQMLSKTS